MDETMLPVSINEAARQFAPVETAATAAAAQAKAMVEARYVMALRRPRVWDQVRQDILAECKRPAFANNKSALYRKPIGAGVEGLGIRFVEVALRCMTNTYIETPTLFEDDTKEVLRVSVTELESNTTWSIDLRVSKTVERSKPMDDGSYLSVRKNSRGATTYTVPATDEDLLNKRAALISKAIRNLGLRVIPGDIQDEAEDIIRSIRLDRAAKDPDAERKAIADAFASLGVPVVELHNYLGHGLDTCSPKQLVELRSIYGAIRDGETTWKQTIDAVRAAAEDSVADLNAKIAAKRSGLASMPPMPSMPAVSNPPALDESVVRDMVAKLRARLEAAPDVDSLDLSQDLIRGIPGDANRAELDVVARKRRKELTGDH